MSGRGARGALSLARSPGLHASTMMLTENTTPLTGIFEMARDDLFERLWNGTAQMEEWTAAVSEGAITHVAENIITVHTT